MENVKRYAILGIIAVIVAAAAGAGGYMLGKQAGATQAANVRANFLAERGLQSGPGQGGQGLSGMPGAPNGGQMPNRDNFASGQVKQLDGNTIQVSTALDVLTVKTDEQTRIEKMDVAGLGDIAVGDRITVQGSRGTDGVMTAQSIQIGGGYAGDANGSAPPGPPSVGTE
jgi:hypothetical protein